MTPRVLASLLSLVSPLLNDDISENKSNLHIMHVIMETTDLHNLLTKVYEIVYCIASIMTMALIATIYYVTEFAKRVFHTHPIYKLLRFITLDV